MLLKLNCQEIEIACEETLAKKNLDINCYMVQCLHLMHVDIARTEKKKVRCVITHTLTYRALCNRASSSGYSVD